MRARPGSRGAVRAPTEQPMGGPEMLERIHEFIAPYRVTRGKGFRLEDIDPGDTRGIGSERKAQARELLARGVAWLAEQQDILYAQDRWSLLLVFQAMDAAGKDGTIRHVMSGVNPQGCQVFSFKQPSPEELDHDFLWRYLRCLPERGRIGIFNRSYYEEVLVVRVRQELLARQKLPARHVKARIWDERLRDIAWLEDYLWRNGTETLKFFLHLSREEQKRRFVARLERPDKHWKFSVSDVDERQHWDQYMHAYEQAIRATATPEAPWYVVPADNKWFTRLVVVAAIVERLAALELRYPQVGPEEKAALAEALERLEAEAGGGRSKKRPAPGAGRAPRG